MKARPLLLLLLLLLGGYSEGLEGVSFYLLSCFLTSVSPPSFIVTFFPFTLVLFLPLPLSSVLPSASLFRFLPAPSPFMAALPPTLPAGPSPQCYLFHSHPFFIVLLPRSLIVSPPSFPPFQRRPSFLLFLTPPFSPSLVVAACPPSLPPSSFGAPPSQYSPPCSHLASQISFLAPQRTLLLPPQL